MAPTKTLRAWLKHGSREQEPPVDSALKTNNFSRRRTATSGRLRYFEKGLPLDAAMQSTGYDQRHQSENRRHPFHQHLVRMNMSPQEDRIGRCSKVGKETIFGFLKALEIFVDQNYLESRRSSFGDHDASYTTLSRIFTRRAGVLVSPKPTYSYTIILPPSKSKFKLSTRRPLIVRYIGEFPGRRRVLGTTTVIGRLPSQSVACRGNRISYRLFDLFMLISFDSPASLGTCIVPSSGRLY